MRSLGIFMYLFILISTWGVAPGLVIRRFRNNLNYSEQLPAHIPY